MTSLNPVLTCGNQVMEAICLHKKLSKKIAKAQTIDLFKRLNYPMPICCLTAILMKLVVDRNNV
jgi:peptide/nickel transport system ATP-binding protein